jgi:tetratricopeptide (TPR) repeat protein
MSLEYAAWTKERQGEGSYDRAFRPLALVPAKGALRGQRPADPRRVERDFKELARLMPEESERRIDRALGRFRGEALAERLASESDRHLPGNPREAFRFADLAYLVAIRSGPEAAGAAVRAAARKANAERVLGRHDAADMHFGFAHQLAATAQVASPIVSAELDRFEGALRLDQRRFAEAEAHFRRARIQYDLLEDVRRRDHMDLNLAHVEYCRGNLGAALKAALRLYERLDSDRDPVLYLCAENKRERRAGPREAVYVRFSSGGVMERVRLALNVSPGLVLGAILAVLLLGAALQAAPSFGVKVLSETPLAAAPSPATNVRFATRATAYLSRLHGGVMLINLQGAAPAPHAVMSGSAATGVLSFERLAASPELLVVSSPYNTLAFVSLGNTGGTEPPVRRLTVGAIEAFDLKGDKLLVLGIPSRVGPVAPSGAIAWIGALSEDYVKTARPVLMGARGPGARHLDNCSGLALGGVRFLPDGSYLVVPGVEPGAILYTATDAVVRRWTSEEIGIDTDCTRMPDAQGDAFHKVRGERFRFLNAHRVVDAVLPLEAGPGVVVRSVTAGTAHWSLSILTSTGVERIDLPFVGEADERLRGDAIGNHLVFLKGPADYTPGKTFAPSTLIVAELAQGAP